MIAMILCLVVSVPFQAVKSVVLPSRACATDQIKTLARSWSIIKAFGDTDPLHDLREKDKVCKSSRATPVSSQVSSISQVSIVERHTKGENLQRFLRSHD